MLKIMSLAAINLSHTRTLNLRAWCSEA